MLDIDGVNGHVALVSRGEVGNFWSSRRLRITTGGRVNLSP